MGILSRRPLSQQVAAWLGPEEAAAPAAATPHPGGPRPGAEALPGVFLPLDQLDQAQEVAAGYDGVVLSMKDP